MDSSISENETSQDCDNSRHKTAVDRLPEKSKIKYLKVYDTFMEWRAEKGAKDFSEHVVLTYFEEMAKTKQPSTMWVNYSMLRAMLSAYDNVHINGYRNLLSFLKSQSKGHTSKKSNVFTAQDIETFLKEAPDESFLDLKVALIFGLAGACRVVELIRIRPEDVQKQSEQAILVNLYTTTSPPQVERSFVIRDEHVNIVERYRALRPADAAPDKFFLQYQDGNCTKQGIGLHKFNVIPKRIAQYLNLPNPETYTGHCLRRTSASLLAQSGADAVLLKQCGGWKSNNGVLRFLEGSYVKRVRRDAPRISPLPTEDPQAELPPNETEHFESAIDKTQHFESPPDKTQHFESPLDETQHSESPLDETEHFESTVTETTLEPQLNNTQQTHCNTDDSQQGSSSNKVTQGTQVEAEFMTEDPELSDTRSQSSDSLDDLLSVEIQGDDCDDPFDLIPDGFDSPPSPEDPYSIEDYQALFDHQQLRSNVDAARARQLRALEERRRSLYEARLQIDSERNQLLRRIGHVAQMWLDHLNSEAQEQTQ